MVQAKGEEINSESYIAMLKRWAITFLKKDNLTLCHNLAIPHISQKTSNYLAAEGIQPTHTPGRSPDANPIENVFAIMKKRLETVSTRTIEEVKTEVVKVWQGKAIPLNIECEDQVVVCGK